MLSQAATTFKQRSDKSPSCLYWWKNSQKNLIIFGIRKTAPKNPKKNQASSLKHIVGHFFTSTYRKIGPQKQELEETQIADSGRASHFLP